MTEETLRKASDLDRQIRELQGERKELISAQAFCQGNMQDVSGRTFRISISKRGSGPDTAVHVSPDTAKEALEREIRGKSEKIRALQEEFSKLGCSIILGRCRE